MNKEQNSILVACGFKRNTIVAIKEIMDNSPRMSSQTMVMSVVLGKDLRSSQKGHCIVETSCTIGLNWNKMIDKVGVSKTKGVNPLYVLSKLPEKLLASMSDGSLEHTKSAKLFYTWLMNDSPYARTFAVKDIEQVLELGYFIVETKHDMRIVVEALMCTRYCWENWCKDYCILFSKLVEGGVNPNLAFQSTYFIKDSGEGSLRAEISHGHSAPQRNMRFAPQLARFVNKGRMLSLEKDKLMRAMKGTWMSEDSLTKYGQEGYLPTPKRKTFKALGGFVTGAVSSGWGDSQGFNVFEYIRDWTKALRNKGAAKGLFYEAYVRNIGTRYLIKEEDFPLLCDMLIDIEFYLMEGSFPEEIKAA